MSSNQMAIHTTPGCTHNGSEYQLGTSGSTTNCSEAAGCTVTETTPNSYGSGFAQAGGGVWATQFDASGILYAACALYPHRCYSWLSFQHLVLECAVFPYVVRKIAMCWLFVSAPTSPLPSVDLIQLRWTSPHGERRMPVIFLALATSPNSLLRRTWF